MSKKLTKLQEENIDKIDDIFTFLFNDFRTLIKNKIRAKYGDLYYREITGSKHPSAYEMSDDYIRNEFARWKIVDENQLKNIQYEHLENIESKISKKYQYIEDLLKIERQIKKNKKRVRELENQLSTSLVDGKKEAIDKVNYEHEKLIKNSTIIKQKLVIDRP